MAKARERSRTPRQRRRYRARKAVWLERNSVTNAPGREEPFEGGYQCHYCERWFKKITIDHIVAKSMWHGSWMADVEENLTWACRPCNQTKRAKFPECRCETCLVAISLYREQMYHDGLDLVT